MFLLLAVDSDITWFVIFATFVIQELWLVCHINMSILVLAWWFTVVLLVI